MAISLWEYRDRQINSNISNFQREKGRQSKPSLLGILRAFFKFFQSLGRFSRARVDAAKENAAIDVKNVGYYKMSTYRGQENEHLI